MSSLTGESIDSFARQLGAKRLRLEFPWEQQPLKDVFVGFSSGISVFQPPDWIDQPPVERSTAASVGPTDEKHFGSFWFQTCTREALSDFLDRLRK